MSKKAYYVAIGCLFVGVILGAGGAYFLGTAYSGQRIIEVWSILKDAEIVESGERAIAAYQHETPAVAIYALHQYLNTLKKVEEGGDTNLTFSKTDINFDAMLAHARLGKIYTVAGQRDLSAQQIDMALQRANQNQRLQTITNESMLMEIVTRLDKGAKK